MVLVKTLESPLDCKEIQPVHPKVDQSWIFVGRIDAEGEAPILWPLDRNSQFIGKDPDPGKDSFENIFEKIYDAATIYNDEYILIY